MSRKLGDVFTSRVRVDDDDEELVPNDDRRTMVFPVPDAYWLPYIIVRDEMELDDAGRFVAPRAEWLWVEDRLLGATAVPFFIEEFIFASRLHITVPPPPAALRMRLADKHLLMMLDAGCPELREWAFLHVAPSFTESGRRSPRSRRLPA